MDKPEKIFEKKKKSIKMDGLSRDQVKCLALLAMTLNHAACAFLAEGSLWWAVLTYTGYLTAPVMCWFVVEGFHSTRNPVRYAERLLLAGFLSQLPYMGALQLKNGNVMFTLLACLLAVHAMNAEFSPERRMIILAVLAGLSVFCDWGGFLPAAAILFEKSRGDRSRQKTAWLLLLAVFGVSMLVDSMTRYNGFPVLWHTAGAAGGFSAAALLVLYGYRGGTAARRSAFSRWFFYLYYPLHLAVIWMIRAAAA